ncbi:hypothetical protein RDWZM_008716 [Blomia tropicalis]|uniref:serine--tRNA ligase n=1 Tax=Blomia tropicalis TaxID=40697 RepID=A0A9Q0M1W0_BLOTA|nr:hypothetical protein BLOT_004444 [Blomia tropicalis]KAJ6217559.1 hypothetical protein RDWZM_008716 [Blomia tropicalis]
MVLDLDLFREDKGGDPERVRTNVRNRFDDVGNVETVIELDQKWRQCRHNLDQLNKAKNKISKEYGIKIKQLKQQGNKGEETTTEKENVVTECEKSFSVVDLLEKVNEIAASCTLEDLKLMRQQVEEKTNSATKELNELEEKRDSILREVGNLLHPDVPISNNEDENAIIRKWGDFDFESKGFKMQSHIDLIQKIGGMDTEHGADIAGSRGYFLRGAGVFLQQALIQYAVRFLSDKEFEPLYTPFWMKKPLMGAVAQLNQFDDELYKVVSSKDNEDNEDKYLIATSEQPICAIHRGEWMSPQSLPIKYAGISTCFRQEVGAHGRDTRGIFRVHQFEKVEQFIICAPNKSWDHFHEMIGNSEKFYQSLGIPYQVVAIVSGALNNAAAMKYDLEAWFPGSKAFRELVSVSNCTDYQSRRLQIRFGQTKKMTGQVDYVHMLNGTMAAITRVICVILEVHQTPEGINIPEPLQKFMPQKYEKFIPFIN